VTVFKQLSAKIEPRTPHTIGIVGGMSEQKQQRLLKSRPDIVVATPGRLWALKQTVGTKDHANANKIDISIQGDEHLEDFFGLRVLVVDEIDRMLEQGHFEELRHIVHDIHR
jgi:ATP-dependent RNA helicase DDX24/MAK5